MCIHAGACGLSFEHDADHTIPAAAEALQAPTSGGFKLMVVTQTLLAEM